MNKKNFFISFLSVFSLSFVLMVNIVLAQALIDSTVDGNSENLCNCDTTLVEGNSCYKYCTGNYEINDILRVVIAGIKIVLGLVGSLALLMFVFGGFTWILAAGNAEKISKGKSIMINALLGIVIVFTSYMIIQFALTALGYQGNWSVVSGS